MHKLLIQGPQIIVSVLLPSGKCPRMPNKLGINKSRDSVKIFLKSGSKSKPRKMQRLPPKKLKSLSADAVKLLVSTTLTVAKSIP